MTAGTAATSNVIVEGNVLLDGGGLGLTGAQYVTSNWTVKGDFTMSTATGTLLSKSSTNVGSLITFGKSGTQTFTNSTTAFISNGVSATVSSTSILVMGATTLFSGTGGTFTVTSGATLKIGSAAGISSSGATGNVQCTTRSFSTTANYEYNGTAAQVTGTGLPATVNNLTIDNSAGVTLSAATTVTNALTLTSGNVTLGANDLTVGSTSGGSTSSHVFTNSTGYLKTAFVGGDTKTFPIGASATSYDPLSITPANAVTFGAKVKAALSNTAGTKDPTLILKKEWDLSPSATPGATNLAFTADAASLNASDGAFTFPAAGSAVLGHWNSMTNAYDANIAASFSGTTWTITGYTGSFSPFIAAAPGAVLSIALQNLTVKGHSTTNIVSWATASEKNNATFNIERSADGQDFATIGTVKGNGTTTDVSTYAFTDNAPLAGINYYRLRSIDMDGKATLSKMVSILNSKTTTGILKAYPSVSTAVLTVDVVTEGIATLNIMDITGKIVLTKTLKDTGFSSNPIDVSGLSNGVYVLMFKSASVQTVQKFIKN